VTDNLLEVKKDNKKPKHYLEEKSKPILSNERRFVQINNLHHQLKAESDNYKDSKQYSEIHIDPKIEETKVKTYMKKSFS